MNSLVEKISRQLNPDTWDEIDEWMHLPEVSELRLCAEGMRQVSLTIAKRYIAAVLDNFSDPTNVTDGMVEISSMPTTARRWIVAAMKAAKEEMK